MTESNERAFPEPRTPHPPPNNGGATGVRLDNLEDRVRTLEDTVKSINDTVIRIDEKMKNIPTKNYLSLWLVGILVAGVLVATINLLIHGGS